MGILDTPAYSRAQADHSFEPLQTIPLADDSALSRITPSFTRTAKNLFTQAQSGLNSIYSPWIIRVDDKLASPLGKFYLYYSTDHDQAMGGIGLAYANDPGGPWTVYGSNPIYQDTVTNFQTENFSTLWDAANSRFIGYYKSSSGFLTYAATSTNGITWTRYGQVLAKPTGSPGDGMTGYFRPFRTGGTFRGYHFVGGGNLAFMALSHSYDGLNWRTDPRPLMQDVDVTGDNGRALIWPSCCPFKFRGDMWVLGAITDFASGGANGNPTQFVAQLSPDMRSLSSAPITVAAANLAGETTPDSFGNVIAYNGSLYTFYRSDGTTAPGGGGGSMAYAVGSAAA